MAKKIQSNICAMLNSLCSVSVWLYGWHAPEFSDGRSRPVHWVL